MRSASEKYDRMLADAGLEGFELRSSESKQNFSEFVFERAPFVLRIVEQPRDSFVDFGTIFEAGKPYYPCDVEIALGVKTAEEIVESQELTDIGQELRRIGAFLEKVESRLQDEHQQTFLDEIKKAKKQREALWMQKFSQSPHERT